MTIANRLRGALALYATSLVALALLYAHAVQHGAAVNRAVAERAERVSAAADRLARIDEMSADAEKYTATNDARYRDRFAAAWRDFGEFDVRVMQASVLDSLRAETQVAGAAAQAEMRDAIAASQAAARRATQMSWGAAGAALALGVLLSIVLVRSIVSPLGRLAQGTKWVSAGRFDYRLDTRSGDEFATVAGDFNAMTERLGELDRMKKDFIARVSHDLKTPLSSMRETNAALLDHMAGPLSARQRQLLELNAESGHRLAAMLGKLLDLSRLEAGQRPTIQLIDVNEIARRSVQATVTGAAQRGVRLSLTTADRSLVLGDSNGISQVIDNLVENAIKFSPANGEVQVSVGQTSSDVTLTVTDEGPGIPVAERERVFERFYQTEIGRSVPGRGVGLGLTICREIVTSHGGRIWVDENQPNGSAFHVVLRRAVAIAAALLMMSTAACATSRHAPETPRPEDLQLRIASLTAEIDATRAQRDSLGAQADSLRAELQRLKEIDLKPRSGRRPPW